MYKIICKDGRAIMAFIADNTALEIVDCGAWFYAAKKADEPTWKEAIAFRADMAGSEADCVYH